MSHSCYRISQKGIGLLPCSEQWRLIKQKNGSTNCTQYAQRSHSSYWASMQCVIRLGDTSIARSMYRTAMAAPYMTCQYSANAYATGLHNKIIWWAIILLPDAQTLADFCYMQQPFPSRCEKHPFFKPRCFWGHTVYPACFLCPTVLPRPSVRRIRPCNTMLYVANPAKCPLENSSARTVQTNPPPCHQAAKERLCLLR